MIWTLLLMSFVLMLHFVETWSFPLRQLKSTITRNHNSVKSSRNLVFRHGTVSDLHLATMEQKIDILKTKQRYKSDLESKIATNKLGSAWNSMNKIAGLWDPRNCNRVTLDGFHSDSELANALNGFYNSFNIFDFSKKIQEPQCNLKHGQHFNSDQKEVAKAFHSTRVNKSYGPDHIRGRLLNSCAQQMSPVFHVFSRSLCRHSTYLMYGKMLS